MTLPKKTHFGFAVAILIAIGTAATAGAQAPHFPDEYEPALVPLSVNTPLAGASGSMWVTVLLISNIGEEVAWTRDVVKGSCHINNCDLSPVGIRPQTTVRGSPYSAYDRFGHLVWIGRESVGDVWMNLRVRDLSRQSETWGTSIPVTGRDDWFGTKFSFVGVAVGTEFRSLLRLYDTGPATLAQAIVKIYRVDPENISRGTTREDILLSENTVSILPPRSDRPGYAEIPLQMELDGEDPLLLRIDVEPLSDEKELWGFVSITNNETQHVTIVTPE